MEQHLRTALGMMSGTSLDGMDMVLMHTDGEADIRMEKHFYVPYPEAMKDRLRALVQADIPLTDLLRVERDLSTLYADALIQSVKHWGIAWSAIDVVGVHGQTIRHVPAEELTWQLGDVNRIAARLSEAGYKGDVVMDFRRRDLAHGGEGAPLAPLFHDALLRNKLTLPAAILNIGGLGNVTLLQDDMPVTGSDTGPGMGLLDQLFLARTGNSVDMDGTVTLQGKADESIVNQLNATPFYTRHFPRSADRYEFAPLLQAVESLSLPDAAATLAAITARGVALTVAEAGATPGQLVWCGGGGRNKGLIKALEAEGFQPTTIADLSVQEDWIEAACFGWFAVRHLRGLPFTLPTTTGSATSSVGGVRVRA